MTRHSIRRRSGKTPIVPRLGALLVLCLLISALLVGSVLLIAHAFLQLWGLTVTFISLPL